MCVDNSEWTRNGDYAPTRFQVRVERECEMMCVRLAICIWARTPPPGRARLPFPPASARLFFARSLTFCILLFLFILLFILFILLFSESQSASWRRS